MDEYMRTVNWSRRVGAWMELDEAFFDYGYSRDCAEQDAWYSICYI